MEKGLLDVSCFAAFPLSRQVNVLFHSLFCSSYVIPMLFPFQLVVLLVMYYVWRDTTSNVMSSEEFGWPRNKLLYVLKLLRGIVYNITSRKVTINLYTVSSDQLSCCIPTHLLLKLFSFSSHGFLGFLVLNLRKKKKHYSCPLHFFLCFF